MIKRYHFKQHQQECKYRIVQCDVCYNDVFLGNIEVKIILYISIFISWLNMLNYHQVMKYLQNYWLIDIVYSV